MTVTDQTPRRFRRVKTAVAGAVVAALALFGAVGMSAPDAADDDQAGMTWSSHGSQGMTWS